MRRALHALAAATIAVALAIVAGAVRPACAAAQSAGVPVQALVGDPATVTALTPLAFTTVFPGLAKTVSPVTGGANAATAGSFRIQGRPGDEISITFALPATLTSGANALAVDTWVGCRNAAASATGCTPFDPSSSHVARLNAPGNPPVGRMHVYLGATVRPLPTQPAGTYTGVVTLSAVYTGL